LLARVVSLVGSPVDTQVVFNGGEIMPDGTTEYKALAFTYQPDSGTMISANPETQQVVTSDPIVNFFVSPVMPVCILRNQDEENPSDEDLEETQKCIDAKKDAKCLCININLTPKGVEPLVEPTKEQKDEMACYKYFSEAFAKKHKCLVLMKITEEEKACRKVWRDFMTSKRTELGIKDGEVAGHLPDTIAGGPPCPGGCYLVESNKINGKIGRSAGGQSRGGKKIKWNKICYCIDGVPYVPKKLTETQITKKKKEKAARKKKWEDLLATCPQADQDAMNACCSDAKQKELRDKRLECFKKAADDVKSDTTPKPESTPID
jgi:hypothetical protein